MAVPTPKSLYFKIRENFKSLPVRDSTSFRNAVKSCLLSMLKLDVEDLSQESERQVDRMVVDFSTHGTRWIREAKYKPEVAFKKHPIYFNKELQISKLQLVLDCPMDGDGDANADEPMEENTSPSFEMKSARQKRREKSELIEIHGHEKIVAAAIKSFKDKGLPDHAFVLQKLKDDPALAPKLRDFLQDTAEEDGATGSITPLRYFELFWLHFRFRSELMHATSPLAVT